MKTPILIWDIDGTLSDSSGAGIDALSRAIEEHFPTTKLYPTVLDTLKTLQEAGFTHGLLTGNIEEGAYLKNKAQNIEGFFEFGAYGGDHWDRNELGFVAAERAAIHHDTCISPEDLLIIGDTVKDIACARACGAKVVAVTTGHGTREDLAEADWVIDEVAELIDILTI